ncbi:hypothetical protein BDM02DRAFT_944022 [Thelephora ganbajun]|uniref:Uncharacterized protein n=1 Tax=Thelephora ganbajun TaxID=370292 RepID=A0ACB6Z538_THEGA|nr:hypothetical protein BDM02DRAFT_944022 [Thelephora ganbajun]
MQHTPSTAIPDSPVTRLSYSWTGTRLLSFPAVATRLCVLGRCGSLRTLTIRTCIPSEIYPSDPHLPTSTTVPKRHCVCTCGSFWVWHVSLVQIFTSSLLPFRWKPREPLSTVPTIWCSCTSSSLTPSTTSDLELLLDRSVQSYGSDFQGSCASRRTSLMSGTRVVLR